MAPQTYKQMRCSHGYAGQCKRAGGYTFLVLDHLPWTLIGMCRKCAEEVRKDLIYEAAQAVLRRYALITSEASGVQSLQLRGADSAEEVEQICAITDQEGMQKHCTPLDRPQVHQMTRIHSIGSRSVKRHPQLARAEMHPKLDASQPAPCGSELDQLGNGAIVTCSLPLRCEQGCSHLSQPGVESAQQELWT